jgi:hypothetical protein
MRSSLLAILLAFVPAALGCGDDIKFPDPPEVPDPAINAVIPAEGFSGRSIRVQVSGDGTEFTEAATVVFGDGITVDGVELASPSSLFVNITLAPDAALGLRDIIVTDTDATLTLPESFEVQDALVVVQDSSLSQGGIGFIRIINKDPANPFVGDLTVTGGTGTEIIVSSFTGNEISATVFLDTDAAPGPIEVEDALGSSVIVGRGNDLPVQARTATPMQPPGKGTGFAATATMSDLTLLFSFTATSALQVGIGFNNSSASFSPTLVWLPGGKWANARGFSDADSLIPTTAGQQMFLVLFDAEFFTGDEYDVIVAEFEPLPNVVNLAEVEPNNVLPQAVSGAQTLFTGALATSNDDDVLKVTLTDGQFIRVITTMGPQDAADTEIEVFSDDGSVVGSLDVDDSSIEGPFDDDFIQLGEFLETASQSAGDYFVVIRSSFFASPVNAAYEASIVVEDGLQ